MANIIFEKESSPRVVDLLPGSYFTTSKSEELFLVCGDKNGDILCLNFNTSKMVCIIGDTKVLYIDPSRIEINISAK